MRTFSPTGSAATTAATASQEPIPAPALPTPGSLPERARALCAALGVDLARIAGAGLEARTPITGEPLAPLAIHDAAAVRDAIARAHQAFLAWRLVPAPRRGELVRAFGERLRSAKRELGELVSLEAGKIRSEGEGEVQEVIEELRRGGVFGPSYDIVSPYERKPLRKAESSDLYRR